MFNNNPDNELLDNSIIKDMKEHHFKIEQISLVKQLDGFSCDVVAKDSKGFRSYLVELDKSQSFKHLYKVKNIRGQKIKSAYQWRKL